MTQVDIRILFLKITVTHFFVHRFEKRLLLLSFGFHYSGTKCACRLCSPSPELITGSNRNDLFFMKKELMQFFFTEKELALFIQVCAHM